MSTFQTNWDAVKCSVRREATLRLLIEKDLRSHGVFDQVIGIDVERDYIAVYYGRLPDKHTKFSKECIKFSFGPEATLDRVHSVPTHIDY